MHAVYGFLFVENQMTQAKLISQEPSIQNIQFSDQSSGLTQLDINRLFRKQLLPKLELSQFKLKYLFCNRPKVKFFLNIFEAWNKKVDQPQSSLTIRTEKQLIQFAYSSIKRISLMSQSEIDKQLQLLFNWFVKKSKNNPNLVVVSMPIKKCENQYYNVMKTFKTNPMIMIEQYRRPKLYLQKYPLSIEKQNRNLKSQIEENEELSRPDKPKKDNLKIENGNNFMTEIGAKIKDKGHQLNQKMIIRQQNKIIQEQLRLRKEIKQIQDHQWSFKLKKGRLGSEGIKNYFDTTFNAALRSIKSSQGNRLQKEANEVQDEMKRLRIHTSFGKRLTSSKNQVKIINPNLTEINRLGLMINPQQIKSKVKKKTKGKTKDLKNS